MNTQQRKPAEQISWRLLGDKGRADSLRGIGLQLKAQMQRENVYNYEVFSRTYAGNDGVYCRIDRNLGPLVDLYTVTIHCPPVGLSKPAKSSPLVPALRAGQFFWVPGCVARFDFIRGAQNSLPEKQGESRYNTVSGGTFLSPKDAGFPAGGVSPGGMVSRAYNVCSLAGSGTDVADAASGIALCPSYLPTEGPYSVSLAFRLNSPVEYDYTLTAKDLINVVRPRLLTSQDGETWAWDCPGGLCPLLGFGTIGHFDNTAVDLPFPGDDDFTITTRFYGLKEVDPSEDCPDAPLAAENYAAGSKYWDTVSDDVSPVSVAATFISSWQETEELEAGISRTVVKSKIFVPDKGVAAYGFTSGSSVSLYYPATISPYYAIWTEQDMKNGKLRFKCLCGSKERYGIFESIEKKSEDPGDGYYITLRNFQYGYTLDSELTTVLVGFMPFPYPYPHGVYLGYNFCGLSLYNGTNILAGKVSNFSSGWRLPPIKTNKIVTGLLYHVCLTYEANGNATLYVTKEGEKTITYYNAMQTTDRFINSDDFGSVDPLVSGKFDFLFSSNGTRDSDAIKSKWTFAANMDVALPRIYKRALKKAEAQLLTQEVFDGVFVADDCEATQLMGEGFSPMVI